LSSILVLLAGPGMLSLVSLSIIEDAVDKVVNVVLLSDTLVVALVEMLVVALVIVAVLLVTVVDVVVEMLVVVLVEVWL